MFTISFYIFSLFISYTDYKKFIIPNILLATMFALMLIFGLFEETISISSFIMPVLVLLFFIAILLLDRSMILGGGDIKYIMVVAFYLNFMIFPIFLILTGLLQTFAILYRQKIQKRRVVAMGPIIFLSVIITDLITFFKIYPF